MPHSHSIPERKSLSRAFVLGIALNSLFVAIEFASGLFTGSMGLISDAGHNLGDVAGLALSMLAFHMSRRKPTERYTYGYRKSTVTVSLLNAIILLVAVGYILTECVDKILNPRPVDGETILWVAAGGVAVNAFTAWLFMKDRANDLNVRGAFLHMAADTLVSAGVVLSGIIIHYTGWYAVDPAIGIAVAVIIVLSTGKLLYGSLRLSLDGVPQETDYDKVLALMQSQEGVCGVHHLHIWAISTTETALTAHISISDVWKMEEIKRKMKEELCDMGIYHATLEFEGENCDCNAEEGCFHSSPATGTAAVRSVHSEEKLCHKDS